MACGTVITSESDTLALSDNTYFGITDGVLGLVTQSITVTHKKDEKEARNHCGLVVNVAFYNENSEIQIEGLGQRSSPNTNDIPSATATTVTLGTNDFGSRIPGAIFIEELSMSRSNQDFVKTSIKAVSFAGIVLT